MIRDYGRYAFQDFRSLDFGNNLLNLNYSLAFEYTLCCNINELKMKYKYNGHVNGISELDIVTALKLNKMCVDSSNLNQVATLKKIKDSMNFTVLTEIDERRSSAFVLNNLNELKTGNVSDAYLENRKRFEMLLTN